MQFLTQQSINWHSLIFVQQHLAILYVYNIGKVVSKLLSYVVQIVK